jgi:two-component system, cell cycle sensor histidine kinase and response regulator CckA
MELFMDRLTTQPVYPFLPALAAIIASAVLAGAGPGLTSTGILVAWAAFDLLLHGRTLSNTILRCLILLLEGSLLSLGSGRMWNSKREAMRSEEWHRQLLGTAAEGIWVLDGSGIINYANARMGEMLATSAGDLVGRNADEFFFPVDLSVERIRAENVRLGHKEQFDRRMRRSDGTEIWVLTCCNLIAADERRAAEALAMMTDITERKRAECALRRSEERFRNLFETVLEGVYQSSKDGRVLAANPMLLQMLGMSSEAELNDLNIAKDLYVDPAVRARLMERLEHEGSFQNAEYELRRRDGRIITVLENARVVRDENGAVLYYEGTLTDITPRKRIEEQLRQAQKVEALGRLAGGIAHDFNNVLTVITGYSQLVLSDLDRDHPARTSAEQVHEAAGNAMALTKRLLSFSRRQAPVEGNLDLNSAIERATPALHLMLGDHPGAGRAPGDKASLLLLCCQEALPVYASQTEIELTLLSLAACVRNAPPRDQLELKTELVHLDEEICRRCGDAQPGRYAALTVRGASDSAARGNAIGLFANPSFTAMDTGESAVAGIFSTHSVITGRGGFIAVDRGSGDHGSGDHGSGARQTFHVFLPCAMAPIGGHGDSGSALTAGGETILLVEDEPLVRELSRDMLERQGYQVVLASDATEAERISAIAGSFDLLITDAVMPSISGIELARRIRASHPGLKVLFISGYSDQPGERDQTAAEGAAFLQKPFSADSLGRKIRQVLSRT